VLLEVLLLKGAIVTIDAMSTHSNFAQAIRNKEADYDRPAIRESGRSAKASTNDSRLLGTS